MSEFQYLSTKSCACCSVRLDTVMKRDVKRDVKRIYQDDLIQSLNSAKNKILTMKNRPINDTIINQGDLICGSCRSYANKYKSELMSTNTSTPNISQTGATRQVWRQTTQPPDPTLPSTSSTTLVHQWDQPNQSDTITVNIPRATNVTTNCIVCKSTKNLINVPDKAYLNTFIANNVLLPSGRKTCKKHLNTKGTFHKTDMYNIEIVSNTSELKDHEVTLLLDRLRHASKTTLFEKFSKKTTITEDECKTYTGLTKNQFEDLLDTLKTIKSSPGRNKAQALGTYLFWLKTGLDYKTISTIFSIDHFQNIGNYSEQVRNSLLKDFVPANLGAIHLTRDEWTKQNTVMAKKLFNVPDDSLILVADGTYIYCQKSANNTLQRKTYSVQKNRHLIKPFVMCTTNGKIIDVYGLFPATENDAKIIETILKNDNNLKSLIKPNDHIILDRGFRDVINTLQTKYKLNTHMPTCAPAKQKQLTSAQANESRLTTKCRWIVEAINGRLKTLFRANNKIHNNLTIPHTIDDIRISAALINKYFGDFGTDNKNDIMIATKMMDRLNMGNRLENILENYHIDAKRKDFQKLDINSVPNFPKLDFDTLCNNITLGPFQLKQGLSYINENFNNPEYSGIEVFADNSRIFDENTRLLRARIQSRHYNSKKYHSYLTYSTNKNDHDAIKDWICTCKSGKRTVGCCSHVASIVYYLGNIKYSTPQKSTLSLNKIFPEHIAIDSSDDSDSTDIDSDNADIEMDTTQQSPRLYPDLSGFKE
jgi:hypothetical protein